MTTLAVDRADYRVTFPRVIRSEWTKLTSLRSTWWALGFMAVITIGLAGAAGWGYDQRILDGEVEAHPAEAIGSAFFALELLGLIIGVLGVLQMSSEYSTGSIRASLTAVPGRLPMLAAKALAFIGLTFSVMIVVSFASFFVSGAFATNDGTTLGDPGVLRGVLGAAVYPVGLGLLGLALGTLIRHTAGAITTFVGMVLIVPTLMMLLPDSVQDDIEPYQPVVAGQAMFALKQSDQIEMLSPGAGALVLAGWVVLLLAGAAAVLRRRDA